MQKWLRRKERNAEIKAYRKLRGYGSRKMATYWCKVQMQMAGWYSREHLVPSY